MTISNSFGQKMKQLTSLCNRLGEDHLFIGFGNPNASILVIGKECATRDLNYDENLRLWRLIADGKPVGDAVSPQKAHAGQYCHQGKGGTSDTWLSYQRLVDEIRGVAPKTRDESLDFLDHCFVTELHDKPSKSEENDKGKLSRIETRIEQLFNDPFWRTFDRIIVAAGGYPARYDRRGRLPHLLGFDDDGHRKVISRGYWYDARRSVGDDGERIMIYTRQLSRMNNTGIQLLHAIAECCR